MQKDRKPEQETTEETRRILDRIDQDSETVGASSMRRVAEQVRDQQQAKDSAAKDAQSDDWVEIWGTRIGRGLGYVFAAFLLFYLLRTYLFDG